MSEPFIADVDHAGNHVCLKFRDFNAGLHFYHDLLGLPIERRRGPADAPVFVWMPGVQVGHATEDPGALRTAVCDHIGIAVKNLDAICARLDAAGCPIERPRNRLHFEEVARDVITIFYRDPEGNIVELLEWQ